MSETTQASTPAPVPERVPIELELTPQQLQTFATGKQYKETGDKAFKSGDPKAALQAYHMSLMYFRGLNKANTAVAKTEQDAQKPKNEIDELLEKVYSNMSACHLKLLNWSRTVETADKALAINKDNLKALFRKGKALGEQGWFERAEAILSDLLKKNPADAPTIKAELEQLRAKDKERERKHNAKLRGFLSRDKSVLQNDKTESTTTDTSPAQPPTSASIEEVKE